MGVERATLRGNMEAELDFDAEATNSIRCAQELNYLPFLYVPRVIKACSSSRILTTEFIEGIKISDREKIKAAGLSVSDIDRKLLRILSEHIFKTGFVHADPHPGNLLVRKINDGCQIVLLDHGLYEELKKPVRESLAGLWVAIAEDDHYSMSLYSKELNVEDYRLFQWLLVKDTLLLD